SSSNNSSVGVYVDDVFLTSFAEMDFTMYDLADVEVLKGPQGTLYGRNSTAGAINLTSSAPRPLRRRVHHPLRRLRHLPGRRLRQHPARRRSGAATVRPDRPAGRRLLV